MTKVVLLSLLMVSLLLFGCVSSTTVSKVENTPTVQIQQPASTMEAAQPSPTPEVETVKEAEVGETLANDELKITLNSAEFMEEIPNSNEFLVATAKDGKTFAVVDVTIENVDTEATSISSIGQFEVKDKDEGYAYNVDSMATISLEQQVDGKLQPGDKIRGKLAFEVPKDAGNLQLVFDFGIFDYAQAKFNLGSQKN